MSDNKIETGGGDIIGSIVGGKDNEIKNISVAVTRNINELASSAETDKPGIKELLTQLQTVIEADKNLNQEDKASALEQVKILAEVGKNSQEGTGQKTGKTAITMLKGLISGLPSAATLVKACSDLLPMISKILGLG